MEMSNCSADALATWGATAKPCDGASLGADVDLLDPAWLNVSLDDVARDAASASFLKRATKVRHAGTLLEVPGPQPHVLGQSLRSKVCSKRTASSSQPRR